MIIRRANLPLDKAGIALIDTSFATDRVYRVVREELGFALAELTVDPPLEKRYPLPLHQLSPDVLVAEVDEEVGGFGQLDFASSNRGVLSHLYVSRPHRRRGVGRALLEEIADQAREAGARCLWIETQNVNYPAIQFYLANGFRLCGLDESFYDPVEHPGELALFFAREL